VPLIEWALLPIAFLTSALAGAIGMGGGVLLIAAMPGLLPVSAIIPVHAVAQLASNGSRALLGWRYIDWQLIGPLVAGAVVGAWAGGGIYASLDLYWLPAIIGVLILLITWVPLPMVRGGGNGALFLLGIYQTAIGMVVGATGPLGAAVLLARKQEKNWLVVNTAVYMSLNHCLRVLAFAFLGFNFYPWLPLLGALAAAVIAGSWVGTRLRSYIPQLNFERAFRILVSLLAARMIAYPLLELS
jgi:uncharacterized protein